MYQYSNYKLWSVLLVIMFLAGCPAVQVTEPGGQQPGIPDDVDTATYHIVRAGETLYGISGLYGRNYSTIANWNGLQPPYVLRKGQRLRVDGPNENIVLPPEGYDNAGVPVNPYPTSPKPVPTPSTAQTHVVQAGETLYSISRHYGKKVSDLTRWNNINPNSYQLSIGQVLVVSKGGSTPAVPSTPVAKYPKPISPVKPVVTRPQIPNSSSSKGFHIVLKGDTLYNIAKHYGFSIQDIAAWNGLHPPYALSLGQSLRVTPPDATTILPPPVSTPKKIAPSFGGNNTIHSVAAGDTMYSIARKYNIKVKQLADWNKLVPPYILSIGQKLIVSSSSGSSGLMPTGNFQKVGLTSTRVHIVQAGENLQSIAKKYGMSFADLVSINKLGAPYNVYPGYKLKVAP